jgi:hypothetical protein
VEKDRTARICALNDQLRQYRNGGRVMLTRGVIELGSNVQDRILERIATFDNWDADNDPYSEHDFGMIEIDGTEIMFKIDYFDCNMEYGSEDPANPELTMRVMTIMRADEY